MTEKRHRIQGAVTIIVNGEIAPKASLGANRNNNQLKQYGFRLTVTENIAVSVNGRHTTKMGIQHFGAFREIAFAR